MSKIIDLIDSYIDRDPAAKGRIETLITSPGLHSIGIYKFSNFLFNIPSNFQPFLSRTYSLRQMKHIRPLIHNYVPVISYNGIIGPVLV